MEKKKAEGEEGRSQQAALVFMTGNAKGGLIHRKALRLRRTGLGQNRGKKKGSKSTRPTIILPIPSKP